MKNIVLSIIFLTLTLISSGQINLGVKGAVTMSSLTTNISDIEEAAQTGWQLGAFVRVGDKWHLQPEVYFSAKPGRLTYSYSDINNPMKTGKVSQDIQLNTVDIPVLIGYKIIDPPTLNVRLQAGPVASMVTGKTISFSSEGVDTPEAPDGYEDDFKNINWALQFGAGIDFLFLTADLRYELGLSKLYENAAAGNNSIDGEMKNNVFILSVGIKFM